MSKTFKEAVISRRTNYSLTNKSVISDKEIEELIQLAIKHVPSAFNSQSTRIVLLLNEHHRKLWSIIKKSLKEVASENGYSAASAKIDHSFASGYGTVLFFEDEKIVKDLQNKYSAYADNFPKWAHQTSAMHQFVIWSGLCDAGFGASIQHYNPLIDEEVSKEWNLPSNWKLIAQMPFGAPTADPEEKSIGSIKERIKIYK